MTHVFASCRGITAGSPSNVCGEKEQTLKSRAAGRGCQADEMPNRMRRLYLSFGIWQSVFGTISLIRRNSFSLSNRPQPNLGAVVVRRLSIPIPRVVGIHQNQ